jgi:hypothetical protein
LKAERRLKGVNLAAKAAGTGLGNSSFCTTEELDLIIKCFRDDLLLTNNIVSKNMWKREKIGSTSRLGPDNILPSIVIDGESLSKIVQRLDVENTTKVIEDVTLN